MIFVRIFNIILRVELGFIEESSLFKFLYFIDISIRGR